VNRPEVLQEVLGAAWPVVLEHLDDAVLVLDSRRILLFVNDRARRLLGYDEDQPVGGRCRLTTRGVDCENACPLTFALQGDIERVEDFTTVYHARDGSPVPLKVTVIPLQDGDGAFRGAVEILRPTDPDPGFVLVGRSESADRLRQRISATARSSNHLMLVGEELVCADVARAIHRFSGVAESLFHHWPGSWGDITPWPPGTVFAHGEDAHSALAVEAPPGWRVIVGVAESVDGNEGAVVECELVELPTASDLGGDLPLVVAGWLKSLAPGVEASPGALDRLCRMARDLGFDRLQPLLSAALAAAGDRIEESHIPTDGYRTAFVDELLQEPNPLAALEGRLVREVLERSGWRMQEAAERLGISRVTLWRKLKDHGIDRPSNCDK
jgi:PAS domain S-box-containing protein